MFYISVILLAALIAVQIAKKSGIPSLMLFLSLGIVSSLIGFNFNDYQFAENFSKIALLIIIFYMYGIINISVTWSFRTISWLFQLIGMMKLYQQQVVRWSKRKIVYYCLKGRIQNRKWLVSIFKEEMYESFIICARYGIS